MSSVKGKTHIEKPCVQFCKKEVAVQLKRVDEYIRKLDDTVVSKPANESLDYLLYEDIIVVNNESDVENASSQMFDDQKPSVELLKAEGYDAAHEEFHKVVEGVDESLLEDDDIEFDDDLFKKLLQEDLQPEPVSELPPQQMPRDTGRRDMGPKEGCMKGVSLPQVAGDGEGTEKVPLAGDEVKKKYKEQENKDSVNAHEGGRIKVTDKNRGTFLMEGAESTDGVAQILNITDPSVLSAAVQKIHLDLEKIPKQSGTKNSAPQPKRHESGSSSVRSIKTLPRIPRLSEWASSSISVREPEVRSGAKVETSLLDRFPKSTIPILRTSAPTRNTKEKKKVCLKNFSEMLQIHVILVARGSHLLPVAHKKDAPTPRKVVSWKQVITLK